LKKM
jgi:hypothetical protein